MAELRIAWSAYRPPLIAYREEARPPLPGTPPPHPSGSDEAATPSPSPPITPPRTSPAPFSPHVSPLFAARVYQANIPTQLYTYPFATRPEKNEDPGHSSPTPHGNPVTLVPYEPGTLVDCHV